MTKEQFINFLRENNLNVKIVKNYETEEETAYSYVGYKGNNIVFDMNEFYIKKTVKVDPLESDVIDFIEFAGDIDWVHELFN